MPARPNLIGRTFGKLTVLGDPAPRDRLGKPQWLCRCECGATVPISTAKLTRPAGVKACAACGGPSLGAGPTEERTCAQCGASFTGGRTSVVCSPECRKERTRVLKSGAVPPAMDLTCAECGEAFTSRQYRKCCSERCRVTRHARQVLQSHRRRAKDDPDLYARHYARRRARLDADPEYADALKARIRARFASDPGYAEIVRARNRRWYAAHRDDILAKRRARLDAMTADEMAAWLRRARRRTRMHRRRFWADLLARPEDHQRYNDLVREYKIRLASRKLADDALSLARYVHDRRHHDPRETR